jgi:GH24 family phage-related lysozyme (muramidase)
MHPEIRHQLYGGDISDYYKKQEPKDVKQENKELADIYSSINRKKIVTEDAYTPPPPAIIQQAEDTKLTFDDILNFIREHEGYRPHVYQDTRGIPTIGIGFNLMRPDAKQILNQVGVDYNSIISGSSNLNDHQIKEIFKMTLSIAYKDAKKWIPSFDSLPKNIKLAILDLSFNMGYSRLSKFIKTKQFIISGDYQSAANELQNSKWATQVGRRVNSIVKLFSS